LRFAATRVSTGPELHYAEQGDPAREAMLLLHGWPDSWFSYSRVLPLLPPRYHAVAVDQRGFGDSERPAAGYGIDDLAADAVAFLDAVGVAQATVVGHSMGSFVARRVAERHPERVARLVLIGSALRAVNDVTRGVQATVRTLADPVPAAFAREFQAGTIHVPVPDAFFDRLIAESLKLPARLWRAVVDGLMAFDDTPDLGRIAAPTLILRGEQDALFPRDDQPRLGAAIPGARLIVYPDTGHCPNWERPERVAADLVAFMAAA
jgi:pimeloyl-ACP methyl ester carboxylesterase